MVMGGGMDAKKKALEDLMGHLDGKDGEELGAAVKPKAVEVTKVGVDADPGSDDGSGAMCEDEGKGKLSPEEIEEIIEALQSKLG